MGMGLVIVDDWEVGGVGATWREVFSYIMVIVGF